MLILIFISAIAGIVGTGLGGVVGVFFGTKPKTLNGVLGFASGIMLSIVCFDLLPEALFISKNIFFVVAATLGGVLMVMLLRLFVDKKNNNSTSDDLLVNKSNEISLNATNKASLYRAGIIMFLAISLHNFPEGMAISSGGYENQTSGIMIGLLIALHNIPEGMSIASPLIGGGMKRTKAVLLTALSGAFTLLGGIVGYLISSFSPLFRALSVAFAGGAMLDVTFGELLPEAMNLGKGYVTSFFVIVGIIIGLILTTILG